MSDALTAFCNVAKERGADANRLKEANRYLGAIYMAGYMVECRLKGLLQVRRRRFAQRGREGHNLLGLWESAGFKLTDIKGNKRLFLDYWSTALRYEQVMSEDSDFDSL